MIFSKIQSKFSEIVECSSPSKFHKAVDGVPYRTVDYSDDGFSFFVFCNDVRTSSCANYIGRLELENGVIF